MKIGNFFKKTKYVSLNSVMTKDGVSGVASAGDQKPKEDGAEEAKKTQAPSEEGKKRRLSARDRISMLADEGTFVELFGDIQSANPLDFDGYEEKKAEAANKSGNSEGVITGICKINGREVALGAMDPYYMMGSMGYGLGEKVTSLAEEATSRDLPLVIFTASGGARMQEGIVSLMQMAKTSAAMRRHSDSGNLYISILTDPTTGGVTASFAMQGDINVSEPGALIGFAGPRVIEQTIRQTLPEGFQRAEFLVDHGMVDIIIEPGSMKDEISKIIDIHSIKRGFMGNLQPQEPAVEKVDEVNVFLEENDITAWDKVKKAREKGRVTTLDIIESIIDDFVELRGDRLFADDAAIVGGIGKFKGVPVTVIGHQKGRDLEENLKRNFGSAHPEGYRKAQRLMNDAEKFGRPIICFIDTAGAFCGLGAEERGQGEAIATSLFEMSGLKVPVISIVIGEGGSGGALALGVANKVFMLSNAIYSVLSPEGFASILWKDASRAGEAAEKMKITASDLKSLDIIDDIIPEADDKEGTITNISKYLEDTLHKLIPMSDEELANDRYAKFRAMGRGK